LLESKNRLNQTIEEQKEVVHCSKILGDLIEDNHISRNLDSIATYFNYGALIFFRAEPVNGTYDALIGAGKTALLQNQELRRLLAEYSAEINMGYEDHEYGMILMDLILNNSSEYNGPLVVRNG